MIQIQLRTASQSDQAAGILYRSTTEHRVYGLDIHSRLDRQVTIRSNRPAPEGAPGDYISPDGFLSDDHVTITLDKRPTETHEGESLSVGDVVELILPGGSTWGTYQIQTQATGSPVLAPQF
jgi:hypothetical protein